MDRTKIIAEMHEDQTLTVTKTSRKKNNLPPFNGIGGNKHMRTKVKGYDQLYEVLQNLSKKATWLWWGLLQERELKTNLCRFKANNNIEAKKITAAYKELLSHDLVIRVSRQLYMINPTAMLPDFTLYEQVSAKWESLKGGSK